MMEENSVCPRCESFLGEVGDLDSCPVCGGNLIGDGSEDD